MNRTLKQLLIATSVACVLAIGGGWLAYRYVIAPPARAAVLDPAQRDKAVAFLDALDQSRYSDAELMLAPVAREALSGGKLEQVWTTLPKQVGTRQSRSAPRGEKIADSEVVTITLQHAMLALDARIHFDTAGLIDGFRVVPAAAAPAAPSALVDDASFKESEVSVAGLPATLAMPRGKGPFPALVLVHGSGPHDRDETIGPNKPFRDLAHGLAAKGIAVLRYEKRTKAKPESFTPNSTLDDEVTHDAVAALALLQTTAGIDAARIFVLGHSLGGMTVPRIINSAPFVKGAIVLAGSARPLHHIVPQQVRYLAMADGDLSADEQTSISEVEQQRDALDAMASGAEAPSTLMLGLSEAYWRDLLSYDPAAVAAKQTTPLLILQGERDYQVTVEGDFKRWQEALATRNNVRFTKYAGLNHLFMSGTGAPNPQEYFVAGKISDGVINDISSWIAETGADAP